MKNDRILLAALLAAGAWFLYTRSKGLSLAGQPTNVMLPYDRIPREGAVAVNASTSTYATNVFSQVTGLVNAFVSKLRGNPGNVPNQPAAGATISRDNVLSWGLQVPPDEPAPYVAATSPTSGEGPYPFWMTPGYLVGGVPFDQPGTALVPSLPWTIPQGFDYIPPPPALR